MIRLYCALLLLLSSPFMTNSDEEVNSKTSGCNVDGIDDIFWLFGEYENKNAISDTYQGPVATFLAHNVDDVLIDETEFFDVKLDSNRTITIFTSDGYKEIEPKIGYLPLSKTKFLLTFNCSKDSRQIKFVQPLIDINNHDPYFEKDDYVYIYQRNSSLEINYEITKDEIISAIDIDMTNSKVTFSMEDNEYFEISEVYENSLTRQSFPTIRTKKEIQTPFSTSLKLSASDVRDPIKTVWTTLEVNVLFENDGNVPVPVFPTSSFEASYKNGKISFSKPLQLSSGAGYLANVTQNGFEEYFKVQFENRALGTLRLEPMEKLFNTRSTLEKNVSFDIEIINIGASNSAKATVSVNILDDDDEEEAAEENDEPENGEEAAEENEEPEENEEENEKDPEDDEEDNCKGGPLFTKHIYSGKYNQNGSIILEETIKVISDDLDLKITQNGWKDYFRTTLKGDKVEIELIKPLNSHDEQEHPFILFDITVTKSRVLSCSTDAFILIKLPPAENFDDISFQHLTYIAHYDGSKLNFQHEITLTRHYESNSLSFSQDGHENLFRTTYSKSDNKVIVEQKRVLLRSDFANKIIMFKIQASDGRKAAYASIVVIWNVLDINSISYYNNKMSLYIFIGLLASISAVCLGVITIMYVGKRKPLSPPRYSEYCNNTTVGSSNNKLPSYEP